MKNTYLKKKGIIAALMISGILAVTACSTNGQSADNSVTKTESTSKNTSSETASADGEYFSERDLKQTVDTSDATKITVKDGETIDITEEGIYLISGNATNCTIKVNADETAKVQLVLDGVTIKNDDFPCIYVVQADKVFVTTTESTNTLSVTGDFKSDGETNTDAVIFSKDDITINGLGTLNIEAAKGNGISGKDEVTLTGGTITINVAGDAIEANEIIAIHDGDFTITSGKDSLHAEDSDDGSKGLIYIEGGTFKINSSDDGIQGTTEVIINGGTFDITAVEGIEATSVTINDGSIKISASDDGINATQKSTQKDVVITINGGNIDITMGQGDTDALDSNGNLYINGGTININAQFAFDYDGKAELNGGTVTVNGETVTEITESMQMGGGMMGGHGGKMMDGQKMEGQAPAGEMPDGQKHQGFKGQKPTDDSDTNN